jgi:hypothetical protein
MALPTLEETLHDLELAFLYREYLHDVYSSENLSFYLEIEDFRSTPEESLKERFGQIVSKYVDDNGERQANIRSC